MFRVFCLSLALVALCLAGCASEARAPTPPMQPTVASAPVTVTPLPPAQPAIKSTPTVSPPAQRQVIPAPYPEPAPMPKREVEPTRPPGLSDAAIVALIIKASLASYPGNCPCPYNSDRAGRSCGGRSAYSRPGGRSPLCFPHDVTPEMIEAYRTKQLTSR